MGVKANVAAVIIAGASIAVSAHHLVVEDHLGAPALNYGPCPGNDYVKTFWVNDAHPSDGTPVPPAGAPGTVQYHGWTEIASCAENLTITSGGQP
jgi:hypothetical protein